MCTVTPDRGDGDDVVTGSVGLSDRYMNPLARKRDFGLYRYNTSQCAHVSILLAFYNSFITGCVAA